MMGGVELEVVLIDVRLAAEGGQVGPQFTQFVLGHRTDLVRDAADLDLDRDFLFVHPTEENARRWSKLKLRPMLRGLRCWMASSPCAIRKGRTLD